MSEVKHQPATPLPWHQGPIDSGDEANAECVFDERGEIVADCGARTALDGVRWAECEGNAAYIDHAAKKYPLLVEALRAFAKGSERETGQHRGNAWALLREIGEDS